MGKPSRSSSSRAATRARGARRRRAHEARDLIALLGITTAASGSAWYVLAQRGTARDVHLGGVPLALGVIALGAVVVLGGLIATLRRRRATDESDESDQLDGARLSPAATRPIIISRYHGRSRPPATARLVAVPAWAPPEPDDEPAIAIDAIDVVLRRDEPASLVLTASELADLLQGLGEFGKAAIELLADQAMTSEAMTAVLDQAALNTHKDVDLTIVVRPDSPPDGADIVVRNREAPRPSGMNGQTVEEFLWRRD